MLPFLIIAQITQWDLIFYGTNDPPQSNDPPRPSGKLKEMNEIEHNSLDARQWRDMHMVRTITFMFIQIIQILIRKVKLRLYRLCFKSIWIR
jgi:hypothetical protein